MEEMKSFGHVVIDGDGLLVTELSFSNKKDAEKCAANLRGMDCEADYRTIELFYKDEQS